MQMLFLEQGLNPALCPSSAGPCSKHPASMSYSLLVFKDTVLCSVCSVQQRWGKPEGYSAVLGDGSSEPMQAEESWVASVP